MREFHAVSRIATEWGDHVDGAMGIEIWREIFCCAGLPSGPRGGETETRESRTGEEEGETYIVS